MWIARDQDGYLGLHLLKPTRATHSWVSRTQYDVENKMINAAVINLSSGDVSEFVELYDWVTWENSPIEVELKVKEQ